jgi:hypothetical protein
MLPRVSAWLQRLGFVGGALAVVRFNKEFRVRP